jgi:2-polyprenyl-3-methyl-5-hydroxy-6-metoxy-1,4-benzoquinol methylase
MIQSISELEDWYSKEDPWDYENNLQDIKRKDILIDELPKRKYMNVLDIGCGHGFITRELPGENLYGIDLSHKSIKQANLLGKRKGKKIKYIQGDLFAINDIFKKKKFDLIIITGVLYPQYIGKSFTYVYHQIDKMLKKDGILATVHISEWTNARFPYLLLKDMYYDYITYTHNLRIYQK